MTTVGNIEEVTTVGATCNRDRLELLLGAFKQTSNERQVSTVKLQNVLDVDGSRGALATGPSAPPVTGHAASPRPMKIMDSRFEKGRCDRAVRCDDCYEWCCGNALGTFWHTRDMPAPEFRRAA